MPTLAQEAFAEGFAALAEIHASSWVFGRASFAGVASALRHDDPRMQGSTDRLFQITALTADLPPTPPKRGDEISSSGKTYRIARLPDTDLATGYTTFVAVLT